ncbi:hypothetical protein M569_08513 [Genlisea aurea]|uniref:Pentatricopeptide repeat-containing protein n=1 Tax=Genlisea aurea TaxID=192259 RepID=S8CN99_9LAMI|nr:hypothetical protein M569_08513 [Genlisea aurea]
MLRHEAPPNSHTFPSVLKACGRTLSTRSVKTTSYTCHSFNAQCVRRGVSSDPYVRTSFIALYSGLGDTGSASKVFSEIPTPCIVAHNAMLDAFGRNGDVDSAFAVFLRMPERDVYSWTTMINGYASNGCFREAIDLFSKMMVDEDVSCNLLRPNEATFVSVISSLANMDGFIALYLGKQIHGYMVRSEKELSTFLGTALIALYGKTGSLEYSRKVFETTAVKEVCTWNAMICSLASNGSEIQALETFETMKRQSVAPDGVTFVGVLSACARGELVGRGLEVFRSMCVEPRMEHYGCVVDLLGRAGMVEEAREFVEGMPLEPDGSVLGSLLGSCKVHGSVDVGGEVGRRAVESFPHCGRYVLMWSIYAAAGRWDRAAELRKEMVRAGIKKVPAFSGVTDSG